MGWKDSFITVDRCLSDLSPWSVLFIWPWPVIIWDLNCPPHLSHFVGQWLRAWTLHRAMSISPDLLPLAWPVGVMTGHYWDGSVSDRNQAGIFCSILGRNSSRVSTMSGNNTQPGLFLLACRICADARPGHFTERLIPPTKLWMVNCVLFVCVCFPFSCFRLNLKVARKTTIKPSYF